MKERNLLRLGYQELEGREVRTTFQIKNINQCLPTKRHSIDRQRKMIPIGPARYCNFVLTPSRAVIGLRPTERST